VNYKRGNGCWPLNAGLIQLRNEMAHYIRRSSEKSTVADIEDCDWPFGRLPRPINNERTCAGCSQLLSCTVYQRSVIFPAFISLNICSVISYLTPRAGSIKSRIQQLPELLILGAGLNVTSEYNDLFSHYRLSTHRRS